MLKTTIIALQFALYWNCTLSACMWRSDSLNL